MTQLNIFAKIVLEIVAILFIGGTTMFGIYEFIKGIISKFEPSSFDEFIILDNFFDKLFPNLLG